MGIFSLFGSKSKSARRAGKHQKQLAMARSRAAVASAERDKAAGIEQLQGQEQMLSQSLSERGLGGGSAGDSMDIGNQQKAGFERARVRAMAGMDENINLAHLGLKAGKSAFKAQRRLGNLQFIDDLLGIAKDANVGEAVKASGGGDYSTF